MGLVTSKKILQKRIEKKREEAQSREYDNTIMRFELDKGYKVRLLWDDDANDVPFIVNWYHYFKDEEEERGERVACAKGHVKDWYNKCPTCAKVSELYDIYKRTESKIDKDNYDKFKKQRSMLIPVYVMVDPTTPDNVGKVRLMPVTQKMVDFIEFQTALTDSKSDDSETNDLMADAVIGQDAYSIENGHDLIIRTKLNPDSPKGQQWKSYQLTFSTKATTLDASVDELAEGLKALDIPSRVYEFDVDKAKDAYRKYVLDMEDSEPEGLETDVSLETDSSGESVDDDLVYDSVDDDSADVVDDLGSDDTLSELDDIDSIISEVNSQSTLDDIDSMLG